MQHDYFSSLLFCGVVVTSKYNFELPYFTYYYFVIILSYIFTLYSTGEVS